MTVRGKLTASNSTAMVRRLLQAKVRNDVSAVRRVEAMT